MNMSKQKKMKKQNGKNSFVNQAFDSIQTDTSKNSNYKGVDLIYKDIDVSINDTPILKNVSGLAKHGDLLAVMGPSGAGKSTLLNALSGRMPIQSGSITLNGEPMNRKFKRKICYVLQHDVFFANLTLKETLTFTALLRLPDKMPKNLKMQRIDDVVHSLDLEKCLKTPMGGIFKPGLSGGEKKRAGIACELLTNPSLIMLDEPTSGLDSAIAYQLMRTMKQYTEESNKTVIATIHQPSSRIFYMFDNVLLLVDGKVAYFGAGAKILDFFSKIEMPCTPNYNPADFILEKVKESDEVLSKILDAADARRFTDDWPAELRESSSKSEEVELPKIEETDTHRTYIKANQTQSLATQSQDLDQYYKEDSKWQTSFWTQFSTLAKRNIIQSKSRILSTLRMIQTFVLAIFSGIIWFQTPRNEASLASRTGVIFFAVMEFSITPVFDAMTSLPHEKGVITKERSAGTYRLSAYYLAKIISESPLNFLLPTAYVVIVYWMAGLTVDGGSFMAFLALFYLNSMVSQSVGFLIGVASADFTYSITVSILVVLSSMLTAGFYVSHFPHWLQWITYASYVHYMYHAPLKVEFLRGPPIQCNPLNETIFEPCRQNLTTEISGAYYLDTLGYTEPIWLDIVVLIAFGIIVHIITYFVLRYARRPGKK